MLTYALKVGSPPCFEKDAVWRRRSGLSTGSPTGGSTLEPTVIGHVSTFRRRRKSALGPPEKWNRWRSLLAPTTFFGCKRTTLSTATAMFCSAKAQAAARVELRGCPTNVRLRASCTSQRFASNRVVAMAVRPPVAAGRLEDVRLPNSRTRLEGYELRGDPAN